MMLFAESNYVRFYLLTASVLIIAAACGLHPSSNSALVLLVGGVVLLGLPHGALDLQVARQSFGHLAAFNIVTFSLAYAALAAAFAFLWLRMPTIGLAAFLVIAAFHFGGDWQPRGIMITRLAYGTVIVTLPTICHAEQVNTIYSMLINGSQPVSSAARGLLLVHSSQPLAIIATAIALGAALAHWRERRLDVIELLAIVATGLVLDPLLYFTAYFCLLHSPRHLFETARSIGLSSLTSIARAAAPIVIATLALAAIFWRLLPAASLNTHLLQIVFMGLASLTIPHMLLEAQQG